MKEVLVAKLDKEDLARYKELNECEKQIRILTIESNSKHRAFWQELNLKHKLGFNGEHYIKGKAIYRQEV